MAIVTGDLYKGFTFGDVSSKDYGVYITQEAAYNAPDRDVEVVEIAGRNGAYILDKGRFKNITVSYKCGIALDDEQSFESAIRSFRNALSSKAGKYVRLEDDYNVNEYRQAAFLGGIEVDMADRRAGEFTVSFDAMPQRFLKSGETAVSVASGETLTNPTLFESHPLLETEGTGTINLNDDNIVITNNPIGNVTLAGTSTVYTGENPLVVDTSLLVNGDPITLEAGTHYSKQLRSATARYTAVSNLSMTGDMDGNAAYTVNKYQVWINATLGAVTFTYGTPATYTNTITFDVTYIPTGGTSTTTTGSLTIIVSYDGANSFSFTEPTGSSIGGGTWHNTSYKRQPIIGVSSRLPIEGTMWFDLDIGEAWTEIGGAIVSVNNSVSFGADLPTLKSGENIITYDNTITQFKIVPRWWEV